MAFCYDYKMECPYAVSVGSETCFCGPDDIWPCEKFWSPEKRAFVKERKLIEYMAKCCGLNGFMEWLNQNGYQHEHEEIKHFSPLIGPNRVHVNFKTPGHAKESIRCCFSDSGHMLCWDM